MFVLIVKLFTGGADIMVVAGVSFVISASNLC